MEAAAILDAFHQDARQFGVGAGDDDSGQIQSRGLAGESSVADKGLARALAALKRQGIAASVIGRIVRGPAAIVVE